jgi:hypothetical protein
MLLGKLKGKGKLLKTKFVLVKVIDRKRGHVSSKKILLPVLQM